MTLISISNLHCSRFTRRLAATLVAVGATACTVDKNLSTVSDGDTEVSAATTVAEPTTSTTSNGDTSSSTTDNGTTGPTSTTDNTTTDNTTTEGTTTDGPPLSCPDNPMVDDCCCFEKNDIFVDNLCTANREVLCGHAVLQCMEGGGSQADGECISASDEALVDCALSALMGDKAGSIHLTLESANNPGQWDRQIFYYIVGDGSVYRVDDTFLDLSGEYLDTGRYDLQPPAFFTACLAGTIAEKADCLRDALSGAPKEICIPAFEYDDSI